MSHGKAVIDRAGTIAFVILYGLLIIFAVLFYNSANLNVALYSGWAILVAGVIFLFLGSRSRRKVREPKGEGERKGVLVESGTYAFVRHPEFLGHILIFVALVLIAQHWASLIIGVVQVVLLYLAMLEEEKGNVKKFGDAYEDYMRRVPRINLIAGIIRFRKKQSNRQGKFHKA